MESNFLQCGSFQTKPFESNFNKIANELLFLFKAQLQSVKLATFFGAFFLVLVKVGNV